MEAVTTVFLLLNTLSAEVGAMIYPFLKGTAARKTTRSLFSDVDSLPRAAMVARRKDVRLIAFRPVRMVAPRESDTSAWLIPPMLDAWSLTDFFETCDLLILSAIISLLTKQLLLRLRRRTTSTGKHGLWRQVSLYISSK